MIYVQMNTRITCDCQDCDSEEYFTDYLPLDATNEEILEAYIYTKRLSSWRLVRKTGKIYCSNYCEEQDTK